MTKKIRRRASEENEPATKKMVWQIQADLDDLAQATAKGSDAVDERFERIEATMATKDQVGNVLEIVQSIDQRLREWGDVGGRLDQVEEDVAELMLKR